MKETEHRIENLPGALSDLDVTESGSWIGVTEFDDEQCLSFAGRTVKLPHPIRFPHVRGIDDQTALVVDGRTGWIKKNAWIITVSGEVRSHFYAGDAIQDVLVSKTFLVFTYFDESALTSPGIEGNGLAIFDLAGNFLFGYRDVFKDDAVDIADCYAACWAETDRLLFFPYMDFPLVSFDLKQKTQKVWETPGVTAGSKAITSLGRQVYFHCPYRSVRNTYSWQIGNEFAEEVGSYSSQLRGLLNGRFLAVGKAGYTIISMSET